MALLNADSRAIFLSPHPDDAVLSCGGWIYQLAQDGQRPIVITIFGGDRPAQVPLSDFARSLQERWQLGEEAPAARRDEDRAACDRLGCYLIHLPFADAVYRSDLQRNPLYTTEESIFDDVTDADIVDEVAAALKARIQRVERPQVIVPLTAGKHVDHVIARQAAEKVEHDLIYYEDYPYAEQPERMTHVWGNSADALHPADDWMSETIELSEEAVQAKIAAFLQHRSQISTFYRDEAEVEQRIRAYAEAVGQGRPAERYWRKR